MLKLLFGLVLALVALRRIQVLWGISATPHVPGLSRASLPAPHPAAPEIRARAWRTAVWILLLAGGLALGVSGALEVLVTLCLGVLNMSDGC